MKMLLLTAMLAAASMAQQTGAHPEKRFDIETAPTTDVVSMAISPDGGKVVFTAAAEGRYRLWVRRLDENAARPLTTTGDATLPFPFWLPDSRSVVFSGHGGLQRVDVETGKTETLLASYNFFRGGSANGDGTILYSSSGALGISRMSSTGGQRSVVTHAAPPREVLHLYPQFLPDGRHFLYYVVGTEDSRGVYVGQIDGGASKRLFGADSAAVYAAGHLLFVREGTLFAQKFDPAKLTLSGSLSPLAEQVPVKTFVPAVSASAAGDIVYRSNLATSFSMGKDNERVTLKVDVTESVVSYFTWFDRAGRELRTAGPPVDVYGAPSLSPDGRSVVFSRIQDGNFDICTVDLESGDLKRLTTDPAVDAYPIWSADGRRVVFSSNRSGVYEMYERPVGVAASETLAMSTLGLRHPMDSSTDGRYRLYRKNTPDIWALRLQGLAEIPIVQGPAEAKWPQFSADGQWIAFQSNESGRFEIHVRGPFAPPSTGRTSLPISINGGAWPRWRSDGAELFYVAPNGMLMAAAFDTRTGQAGKPVPLFSPPMIAGAEYSNYGQQYMVSRDGQRFLVVTVRPTQSPIHVIQNWKAK